MSVESINVSSVASVTTQPQQQTQVQGPTTNPAVQQQQTETVKEEVLPQKLSNDEAVALAERLNEFLDIKQRNLSFSVDKESNSTIIKVHDSETQEVIRQFPSEEAVELAKHLEDAMGIIFNDRA